MQVSAADANLEKHDSKTPNNDEADESNPHCRERENGSTGADIAG